MVTKERVEGKLKDLTEKYKEKIGEIQKIEQEMVSYQELVLQMDDKYVKVKCPQCGGLGYVQGEGKKTSCNMCGGKCYVWMEMFQQNKV